jgi:branched-chain amino acid transport system ATP-binding protein
VETIFAVLGTINRAGVAVFLVEQNVRAALGLAHRAYVLEHGRIAGAGPAAVLLDDPEVRRAYLGPLAVGR